MIDEWDLRSKTHVVLHDNVKNMERCMSVANLPSLGCFAHTMQLCIQPKLSSSTDGTAFVSQLLSQCRSLVGHFSHSVQAKQRLQTIQQSIQGHPLKKLLQDVSTRWNSTYYMTKRLIEQEKALAAYEREYSLPAGVVVPPGFKFKWLKQLCDLLEPLEEATRRVCTDAATAADVIPIAMAMKASVQRSAGDDIRTLQANILSQIGE